MRAAGLTEEEIAELVDMDEERASGEAERNRQIQELQQIVYLEKKAESGELDAAGVEK
eukprot:CAMPEP_0185617524 /NCGR_PEP_ID=MMETSP0436-20130131/43825_1 /TAXON_ID=626734 ORGANISM="Favella taraikaensis, Strain Fe Narragansett Bay" /NCGR_SAMPLE_ID=MMETSP0436 /ASSEMBLY_ACC=CAM_ASM_000390 /LENGTH=57 /DNA_ID=CAMNT_0028255271 /DNA_START=21 /DNA_END=191 /DNA_ORIENTATION=-